MPLSEDQKYCADCGSEMKVIGKEFVRREFRFTPAKGEIVNIYVETAKCPVCYALALSQAVFATNLTMSKARSSLFPNTTANDKILRGITYRAIHSMVINTKGGKGRPYCINCKKMFSDLIR